MHKKIKKVNKNKNVPKKVIVNKVEQISSANNYLELPIKDIKTDLLGMLAFALLSFAAIMILRAYSISLNDILSLFS